MTNEPDPRVAICEKGARCTLDHNDPDFAWMNRVGARHVRRELELRDEEMIKGER